MAIVALGAVGVAGVSQTTPACRIRNSAHQFVRYYRALESSSVRTGFVDRVALSLALVDANRSACVETINPPSS